MSTLADRLAIALAGPPRLKLVDLARACNVRPPSVNAWTSGKTKALEGANLLAASEFLGVNPWWLATGEGPMRPGSEPVVWSRRAKENDPVWPFSVVSESDIRTLAPADKHRLEGAIALTLAQIGPRTAAGEKQARSRLDDAAAIMRSASVSAANDPDYVAIRKVSIKITAGVPGFATEYQRDDGTGGSLYLSRQWVEKHRYRLQALFATSAKGGSMLPRVKEDDLIVINTDDTTQRADEVFAVNHEGEFTLKRLKKRLSHWYLYSDNEDQQAYPPVMCSALTFIIGRAVLMQTVQI